MPHRELGGEGLSFRNQGLILVQPGSVAGNYVVLLGSYLEQCTLNI
jgi:hypothetical protein